MSETPRRRKRALEGRAYYIILALCVAAIAVSGYFLTQGLLAVRTGGFGKSPAAAVSGQASLEAQREAIHHQDQAMTRPQTTPPQAEPVQTPAGKEPEQVPAAAPAPEKSEVPDPAPAAEEAAYVWPVEGAVDREFSLEVFAYDATMGDWRTHDGLDIAAEVGTSVGACAAGTVESVTQDDMLGTMVTIDHGAGLKSVYANLSQTVAVDQGDPVEAGTVIGTVGTSAIAESAGPSHLHFAMKEYGRGVDPLNYLH